MADRSFRTVPGLIVTLALTGVLLTASSGWPARDLWTTKEPMPTPRTLLSAAAADGKVYVLGGTIQRNNIWHDKPDVEAYDPVTGTWAVCADMPTPRSGMAVAVVDGKIYIIGGGLDSDGRSVSTVDVYDPRTDTWTEGDSLSQSRVLAAASVLDGRIYIMGGQPYYSRGGTIPPDYSSVEVHDPVTDTWADGTQLPVKLSALAAATVDGKIYTLGGATGFYGSRAVYMYDPVPDAWVRMEQDLPTAPHQAGSQYYRCVAESIGGRIYFVGTSRREVHVFDPTTDVWTRGESLPDPMENMASCVVDGRLYCVGGGRSGAEEATLRVFEPAIPGWADGSTTELSALAGEAAELPVHVGGGPWDDDTTPSLFVDLAPFGKDGRTDLVYQADGQYSARLPVPPLGNGAYLLPVRMVVPGALPRYLYGIELGVWPGSDLPILSEDLASGWEAVARSIDQLLPAQSAVLYTGTAACAVQTRKSFSGWILTLEPPDALDPFGYESLRLAIHLGDLVPGDRDRFTLSLGGGTESIDLLDSTWVDWSRTEWQEIEIPLAAFGASGPITSVQLSGTPVGTFYLDDVSLVAGKAPPPPPPTAVLGTRSGAGPEAFALAQNYPNPFNSTTTIRFELPVAGKAELVLYNLAGQKVATLAEGHRAAGSHSVRWDGQDEARRELASGVYVYRLVAGERMTTHKLLLLR